MPQFRARKPKIADDERALRVCDALELIPSREAEIREQLITAKDARARALAMHEPLLVALWDEVICERLERLAGFDEIRALAEQIPDSEEKVN